MATVVGRVLRFSIYKKILPCSCQKRSAYIGQPLKDPEVSKRNYEVSKDPEEWKNVIRLLPQKTVPPFVVKSEYPSGWVPPNETSKSHEYFVERTKNHMVPVYLHQGDRGQAKITVVKKVRGNIWLLHDELKTHIETMEGRRVASQVVESNSVIKFKGDHYHWVEQFLLSKGF